MTRGTLKPGDTLQLRGGTYQSRIVNPWQSNCDIGGNGGQSTVLPLKIAGTQASPIIIENYPGETVIIDGTDADMKTETWTPCGNGAYQSTGLNVGSSNTAQIWINPSGPDDPGTRLKWSWSQSCSLNPGEMSGAGGVKMFVRLPNDANPNTADIHMSSEGGDAARGSIYSVAGASWITIRKNPSGGGFYAKYSRNNFEATGGDHITFDGVNFVAGGSRDYGGCIRAGGSGANYITVKNGVCHDVMGEGMAYYGGGPSSGVQLKGNVFENMTVYKTGLGWLDGGGLGNTLGMSIVIKNCADCVVRNNNLKGSWGPAVHITNSSNGGVDSANFLVEGNKIWDFGYDNGQSGQGRDQAGVKVGTQNGQGFGGTIRNNKIYNAMFTYKSPVTGPPSGIWVEVSGVTITGNIISDVQGPCISGGSSVSGNQCGKGLLTLQDILPSTTPSPSPTPTPLPSPATLKGDLNNDHIVNSLDWSTMNSKWFSSDATADLNADGIVNSLDFSIMNGNWLKSG